MYRSESLKAVTRESAKYRSYLMGLRKVSERAEIITFMCKRDENYKLETEICKSQESLCGNDNGVRAAQFVATKDAAVKGTIFPHRHTHTHT